MPLSDIVNVQITTQNPGVTQAGFGVPLIVSHSAAWTERTRTYASTADVLGDFSATSPEYLAAVAIFSQSPRPPTLMIGRAANVPTMIHTIALVAAALSLVAYKVRVFVNGVLQTATFTPTAIAAWQANHNYNAGDLVSNDAAPTKVYKCTIGGMSAGAGGPTGTGGAIVDNAATWAYQGSLVGGTANDVVIAGLVAAINALAAPAPNFTAAATGSAGAKIVTCTGNAPGNWFAVEPLATDPAQVSNLMTLKETTADPGITADLTAIALESSAWYGLISTFKGSIATAIAAWTETNTKLFPCALADTEIPTTADNGATDIAHALKGSSYFRTAPFYHPRAYEFADAAEIGRFFPINPGGDNWRMKTLVGVVAVNYTGTHIVNLKAKMCNFYYLLANVSVIGGNGKVSGNEYIDVIRGRDWWVARVGTRLANLLIQSEKIPYTDPGVALVEAEIRAQNDEGIAAGLIAANPAPTVTVPKVANVSGADKAARVLNNVNTVWKLAGALNAINVNATITA